MVDICGGSGGSNGGGGGGSIESMVKNYATAQKQYENSAGNRSPDVVANQQKAQKAFDKLRSRLPNMNAKGQKAFMDAYTKYL